MKKITLLAFMALAFMAGAIISVNSPAAAQGIYLDFGTRAPAIATTMDPATGMTVGVVTERAGVVTETENGMEIAERVATTAPTQHDSRPLTAAKTAGQCKTAFANRTGATDPHQARRVTSRCAQVIPERS